MKPIHLDKKGRRIVIRSSVPVGGLKTTIPGAYESVSGHWTVPLSIESCKLLRQKFGSRLEFSNELKRWIAGVQASRKYMKRLATRESAKLFVLPTAAPKLYKAMKARKYQTVGVRFIADNPATLLADDPGLGKTLQLLGGIVESNTPGPYLVVSPKTAADTVWKREIERWLPAHTAVTVGDYRYQREKTLAETELTATTWLIVHPEMVQVSAWWICGQLVEKRIVRRNKRTGRRRLFTVERPCDQRTDSGQKQLKVLSCGHERLKNTKEHKAPSYPHLFDVEWGAIVVDESHESLIRRSGRPTQRRRGLDMLKTRNDGLRVAMSGTPFDSKPYQLWGTLNWLDSQQYSAFHRWSALFWEKGGYTGFEIGDFRKSRESLLWDSLSAISLRRTKAEVASDLPPKMEIGTPLDPHDPSSPIGIWLPMEGKQEKAYRAMEKMSVAELDSGRLEAVTALAELTRLKQLACSYGDITQRLVRGRCKEDLCDECERHGWHEEMSFQYVPKLPSNKFDWTIESLEEWGFPREPLTNVVIVSFYTGILNEFARGIEKHFKTKEGNRLCTAITGQTPPKHRRAVIDRFNSGSGPRIMMLNVKAGGTAITLDTADRMIFISETRIPDQQKQAEDRIHRVSNPRHCMYYYLRSLDTVDVGTAMINQEYIADTHRLLDQRRGVDYMRHVLDLSHGL